MTSMISLILAFMLTMGGGPVAYVSPGAAVSPVNAGNSSSLNLDLNEKPRLGEISKIRLFESGLITQKPRIVGLFRISFEKSLLVEHYYFRARFYDPIMGRFLSTDPMGYTDSMNLYQGFNMNPINFVDPFGKQQWMIEEELMQEEILKQHMKKRYGNIIGELEFSKIICKKRRIETIMSTSFFVGLATSLVAPHLSVPAIIASVGAISTFSALESYSERKQSGQTESEARRGAFGAATGLNYLFNLMGYDYGTLDGMSQGEIENAWSTLIGGISGGWLGKIFAAPATEIVTSESGLTALKTRNVPKQLSVVSDKTIETFMQEANKRGLIISEHAIGRLIGRESHVSLDMILKTLEKGQKFYDPKNKTISYILDRAFASGKSILVGKNPETGKITTIITGKSKSIKRPRFLILE